ncbi:NmrA family NAD(P)-binding protein [Naumannella cuiyingiana]|uniref:Uncharacterized protein YbjT (DUF2867 family) n=1 Tax=Naumannella cuiyingiana TaxID=1347891 RepID=A0A7Z0D9V0_9ACTN|nr:NmrA family NAD(P)-binding protein [Naumannella cuiyingiana]NYI71635.1 uncharacterized protein YbjT (DUF2867 family) [Naumannella cuiyingiana]
MNTDSTSSINSSTTDNPPADKGQATLVLGGTGRIGRRVAERLKARDVNVRIGSRHNDPPFDWEDSSTWAGAFTGVSAAYLMYYPEVEWPGAAKAIGTVAQLAVDAGVQRLVLLSARGQDEAVRCEEAVTRLPVEWTIVAPSSFNQNFDEGVFLDPIREGVLALPFGDNADPFIDVEDIADVVTAALTEPGHVGERYELTGPRLLTFAEAVAEIGKQSGRELEYRPITTQEFADAVAAEGAPREFADTLSPLLAEFFDGRNSYLTNDVERALGRKPRDFADWVEEVARTGVWNAKPATV